ncbi:uncharacterized protein LOC102805544 [Saccoglossus kowalevskii]|uniref:Uncharacterized protein LOC102805544 n=1 Tax=Saccoglossus kowalevskii TaxID=10224 RepID=A0ABM0ME61_SACKO|nr:PREDICTED: uncharacterized protein LOC102805544 [Saccoglossus kowalevskii]
MHLKFPKNRHFYTWEELSCLSRAIGFQSDTLKKCIPDEITTQEPAIKLKELRKLIERKYFSDALDRSCNMHTADYNVNVLSKALLLLEHKLLSFPELNDVRIAYEAYEGGDMKGMIIDEYTLLRTLKMCGRVVAPMKLMHRVKHMKSDFDEKGRIQYYEFLDLLVLCEYCNNVSLDDFKEEAVKKNWRHLFKMDDFNPLFVTGDEKVHEYLNQTFKDTELNYGKTHHGDKKLPKENSVNIEARKQQVEFHGQRYRELHQYIDESSAQVKKSKAGTITSRPTSAPVVQRFLTPVFTVKVEKRPHTVDAINYNPDVHRLRNQVNPPRRKTRPVSAPAGSSTSLEFHHPSEVMAVDEKKMKYMRYSSHKGRQNICSAPSGLYVGSTEAPMSVHVNIPHSKPHPPSMQWCSSELTASHNASAQPWRKSLPYKRPSTPKCITAKETDTHQDLVSCLQFDIDTLKERSVKRLNEDIDDTLPLFRFKREERLKNQKPPLPPKKVRQKKQEALTDEQIKRLTYPQPRAFMAEHEKHCDARAYGIGQSTQNIKRERQTPARKNCDLSNSKEQTKLVIQYTKDRHNCERLPNGCGDTKPIYIDKLNGYYTESKVTPFNLNNMEHDKYRAARVGTAALLYEFLMEKKGKEQEEKEEENHTEEEEELPKEEDLKFESEAKRHMGIGVLGKRLSTIDEIKIGGIDLSELDRLTVSSKDDDKSKTSVTSKSPVSSKSISLTKLSTIPETKTKRTSAYEQKKTKDAMKRLSLALVEPEKGKSHPRRKSDIADEANDHNGMEEKVESEPAGQKINIFKKKMWKNNRQMKQLVNSKKLSLRLKQSLDQ